MPSRIRRWCTADSASSAGMGARRASTPRSLRMSRPQPSSTASTACWHSRSTADSSAPVAGVEVEQRGQPPGKEHPLVVALRQPGQLPTGQDRTGEGEPVALVRRLVERVAVGAGGGGEAHDQRLAVRVDGRVGHLGEELVEVAEEARRLVAEDRERAVVAHRADRLVPGLGHGRGRAREVLVGVAEGALGDARARRSSRRGAGARAAARRR